MVSELNSRLSIQGSSLVSDITYVVFLGKSLHSHSASVHPGEQMGTVKFNAIKAREETLLVPSCYKTGIKLWPDGPLGSFMLLDFAHRQYKNVHIVKFSLPQSINL